MASPEEKVVTDSLTVKFKSGIQPDGQISRVTLFQYGQMIQLTPKQAVSLADLILQRIPR